MASYKYSKYLTENKSDAFDYIYKPGEKPTNSGIYRCEGCADEVACNKGNPLPSQNHKQHSPSQGAIRWKMIVYAVQN